MTAVATLKAPPHSIDAEQAVIGAVLAYSEVLHDIELMPEDFYRREHRTIWEAMLAMRDRGDAVDAITLQEALAADGKLAEAGGTDYLVELATSTSSSANVRSYAQIVADRASLRRVISAAHQIADMGYNPDGRTAAEVQSQAAGMLAELDSGDTGEPVPVDSAFKAAIAELERRMERKGQLLGTPTGFRDIDARTQGLMPGNLIIVAARPSMGKSVFAANIAEHVAMQGKLVIVFNLEMSSEEMMFRLIASQGRVPMDRLRVADLSNEQWDRVAGLGGKVKGRPLFVSDNPILTSAQVLSRARRIARRMNMTPGLIVVDYLQLLSDKGDNLNERTSKISRNLKLAAKALNCPMVALSQLNRKVDDRADKRPIMSDLRDSGAVEQDADQIAMLYRDEVYNENSTRKGIVEVIWRKFRNGQIGTDYLASQLEHCRFDNLQYGQVPPPPEPKEKSGGFNYG